MLLTATNILLTTNNGLRIYQYILSEHFPKKDFRNLLSQGRPVPNPFVAGGLLQLQLRDGSYCHQDLTRPGFQGNALDLAALHYKVATLPELYYLLNQNLRLGLMIPAQELLDQLLKAEEDERHPRLSYFQPPISNTQPSETLNLPALFQRITSPEYKQQTEALRQLEDPKEIRRFKAEHFPYVTFGGRFEKRSDSHLLQPSGLLVIDLDDLPEVAPVREALLSQSDYETELLFVSPSSRGLKWVTGYNPQDISHLQFFQLLSSYLEAVFDLKPDPSGKDISRACFLCYDPDAFLNRKYIYPVETSRPDQ